MSVRVSEKGGGVDGQAIRALKADILSRLQESHEKIYAAIFFECAEADSSDDFNQTTGYHCLIKLLEKFKCRENEPLSIHICQLLLLTFGDNLLEAPDALL